MTTPNKNVTINFENLADRNFVMCNVMPRLISRTQFEEKYSSTTVHTTNSTFEDLEVIFYVSFGNDEDGNTANCILTESLLQALKISVTELQNQAYNNAAERYEVKTIGTKLNELGCPFPVNVDFPLYVVTNKSNMFGAGVILSPDVQEEITKMIGNNYIVIPSSVHEVLVIPADNENHSIEALTEMIQAINKTEVAPDEVLSDHPYEINYLPF